MQIKNLSQNSIEEIVACFSDAFSDYKIKMPTSPEFWQNRWKWARVNYELSYGVFDGDQMVAFIINGIDQHEGQLTAFNTGTGVLKNYRGQQWVDKMYAYALPHFKQHGVTKLMLEVLQSNARAIRVYERIGFHISRQLKCYKGTLKSVHEGIKVRQADFENLTRQPSPTHHFYSWDNRNEAVRTAENTYETYQTYNSADEYMGRFTILPSTGYLVQYEAETAKFSQLIAGIIQVNPEVKVNNIDSRRTEIIQQFLEAGLENTVDQYEMEMDIAEI